MKAVTKITFFDENGAKFFGEGPARLLHAVEKTGSLRGAAMSMDMAYTKALRILKQAEAVLGYSLTARVVGGKDGGGSRLTKEGKAWLERYEAYRDACVESNSRLYQEFFPEHAYGNIGCVIMASGLGRRFGGNKLMAEFHGQPLICQVLQATEGIFAKRVVVTRHEEIAVLCEQRGIPVILHDLPHRSDTVRLGLQEMKGMNRCMFCPGDQPLLTKDTVSALAEVSAEENGLIWRAAYGETQGSPVVFPAWSFEELLDLPEGKGGSVVVKKYSEQVRLVQVKDIYELKDVDSPEDLRKLRER